MAFSILFFGLIIIFMVSLNHNYLKSNYSVYANPNNTIPLSMNIVSGAKVHYSYDKRYIYKFRHNGQDVFRLSPVSIKKFTNLKVTQQYRNNFLVPTVEINNVKIIKKN